MNKSHGTFDSETYDTHYDIHYRMSTSGHNALHYLRYIDMDAFQKKAPHC